MHHVTGPHTIGYFVRILGNNRSPLVRPQHDVLFCCVLKVRSELSSVIKRIKQLGEEGVGSRSSKMKNELEKVLD